MPAVARVAPAGAAALAFLDATVRDNAVVYPPAAVRARFELIAAYSPEESRLFRAWQRFKTGQ